MELLAYSVRVVDNTHKYHDQEDVIGGEEGEDKRVYSTEIRRMVLRARRKEMTGSSQNYEQPSTALTVATVRRKSCINLQTIRISRYILVHLKSRM